jgi:dihydrofolate reductase
MILSQIVAVAANGVIGKDNDLVWHLPDDMAYFKEKTKGLPVIMGRKNYLSLPEKFRPLPKRPNIVVTRQPDFEAPGCELAHSMEQAIALAQAHGHDEIFIIGGAEIYRQSLHLCQRIYLTEIHGEFEGDTFYPPLDKSQWEETSRTHHPADARHSHAFDFVIYERKN